MNTKSRFRMEIKEISEDGTFEGMLSTYGNVDQGRDIVEPGAFKKTLKDHGNTVPLLWQHDSSSPIGMLELEDRKDGLYCKGRLELELQKAKEAYICLKNRLIKGLSIGFEAIRDRVKGGVRHLEEIRLYEGSIVTFPMNELANVTAVKSLAGAKGDFVQELATIQTLATFGQMQYALTEALDSIIFMEGSKEDKLNLAKTIVEQFSESFLTFLPSFLDEFEEIYGPSERLSALDPEVKRGILKQIKSLADTEADIDITSKSPADDKTAPIPGDHAADQLDEKMVDRLVDAIPQFNN